MAELAVLAGAVGALAWRLPGRVALLRAKHRSLAGHARIARAIASLVPYYEFGEAEFCNADSVPQEVVRLRRAGFERLAALYAQRFPRTRALTRDVESGLSDLQFTAVYRVPFQFSRHVRTHLGLGAFLQASAGAMITDLDGNSFYDLAGSYGVNLLGYDFYKECVAQGTQSVQALGPVLGAYHPEVAYNVARLRAISGLDEVSFHMSGTEAVMQAVRLARFHTRRTHVVRFAGAYHGWWGDVQPGIGNPVPARETYTLADMSDRSLHVLRKRRDIACVLVNPLQALHPNQVAPSDSALVEGERFASFDRVAYSRWLHQLRQVCAEHRVPLIFDEVFVGFRLAMGGAAEFFGVQPDLVTYGKTLGGGLPVGVVCGRRDLMRRYRDNQPGDICLARGTFNANPYVMGTMAAFLRGLESPAVQALYDGLTETWDRRAAQLNAALADEELPLMVANLSTIWTVCFKVPSRYNWMLQYYLRAEGLLLSWVGTGRIVFSLNYTEQDFAAVAERFLAAARAMARDGWWWNDGAITGKSIRRRVLREMLRHYRRP